MRYVLIVAVILFAGWYFFVWKPPQQSPELPSEKSVPPVLNSTTLDQFGSELYSDLKGAETSRALLTKLQGELRQMANQPPHLRDPTERRIHSQSVSLLTTMIENTQEKLFFERSLTDAIAKQTEATMAAPDSKQSETERRNKFFVQGVRNNWKRRMQEMQVKTDLEIEAIQKAESKSQ